MRTSIRGGVEDFLCPFTDMYITQGSNGGFSHKGIMANDVRGKEPGVRYHIYAPCDIICRKVYPSSGQAMWQSINKVRFANGRIDFATFMVAHDNTMDSYVGQTIKQGESFFQMGDKGNATGVHTHIQVSQSNDMSWYKNEYGIYKFNNEYDLDDCYFVDFTNILEGLGGNWKKTTDIEVNSNYKCNYNMYVRWGAGINYGVKLVKDLTPNGKENSLYKDPNSLAIYKEGTVFTCLEEINNEYGKWARTPSGYVCIKGASGKEYCSK